MLNYKGHLDTVECLESCLKLNYSNFEIIVVDNSDTNDSIEYILNWANGKIDSIKTLFEGILQPYIKKPINIKVLMEHEIESAEGDGSNKLTLIKANSNQGFAAGNNIGLRYVMQRDDFGFAWILNNDTVVDSDALKALVNYYAEANTEGNKKLGILGSALLYYDTPELVQGVGGKFNKYFAVTGHQGQGLPVKALAAKEHMEIDYVIGASMFVSRHFLEEVGLMSEDYFLYFEEIDWATVAKKYHYYIDYCPTSLVYHKEGATINNAIDYKKKKSELADYYALRNRLLFTRKYYPQYLPLTQLSFLIVIANRIKRKELKRVGMIMKMLFNPSRPYQQEDPLLKR